MLDWVGRNHITPKYSSGEKSVICELWIACDVLQDDLTPMLLAVKENKQHIVEFLVKKKASIHAVDQLGRYSSLSFQTLWVRVLAVSLHP
jgi:hypothetical protein